MTYRRVDTLSGRWEELGVLSAIESALEKIGFDDAYVDAMIASSSVGATPAKSKVVKDQIWGMIDIDQSCLRLVDCPILQRMRGIRQTGFSYLTYPPAEHSRFTHSLGMMHVVARFLAAMAKQAGAGQNPTGPFQFWQADDVWSRLLMHAALLHDIGHLPFSHVSEAIVEADQNLFHCGPVSVDAFLFEVEDCLAPEKDIHFVRMPFSRNNPDASLQEVLCSICLSKRSSRGYFENRSDDYWAQSGRRTSRASRNHLRSGNRRR